MSSDVDRVSATPSRRLTCPVCLRQSMRRIGRTGFLQRKVFALFGYYPWECASCRFQKLFHYRGSRKSHRNGE